MSDWCPFVTRRDGPAWKVGYSFVGEAGPKRGEVDHSAEGWWPGIYSALDGPARKSWTFTIGLDRTEQHYPFRAHCWHAGDVDNDGAVAANLDFIGKEYLGLKGQPLNPYQIEMGVRITEWCAAQEGRDTFRRFDGWDPDEAGLWLLAEHNEVSDVWTACPSDRMAELWRTFDMVSQADFDAYKGKQNAINDYQNVIIKATWARIDYLAKIATDHEARLKALELNSTLQAMR